MTLFSEESNQEVRKSKPDRDLQARKQSNSPGMLGKLSSLKNERPVPVDAAVTLDSARFLKRINALEKEAEELKSKLSRQNRKLRDVIYRLEAQGDVRWCEECDTVHAIDETCECEADINPCLTDSERNR